MARFEAILDAYGADPARWPEAERDAALELMRREPEGAQAALAAARALDAALDAAPDAAPSEALRARVLAAAQSGESAESQAAARGWLGALAGVFAVSGRTATAHPAAALMALFVIGVGAGYSAGGAALREQALEAALTAAFESPDPGYGAQDG